MRNLKVLGFVFVVSFLLVAPGAFASVTTPEAVIDEEALSLAPSKVCHPKKPVTCRAADLSVSSDVASTEAVDSFAVSLSGLEKVNLLDQATKVRFQGQFALGQMICMPPKWNCRTNTLN